MTITTKATVDGFLAQMSLAVVGASRSGQKFGNVAYRELKAQGRQLFPIHPAADIIEGDPAYASFAALPEPVGAAWICVPPERTKQVVKDAAAAGIRHVWMQQGAESDAAVEFCKTNGISAVYGECILMFAQPLKFYHRPHRWLWQALGKLPK